MKADTTDTTRIAQVLEEFADALHRKDASAAVAVFSPDAITYDLDPPLAHESREVRDPERTQMWFDTWSSGIESTPKDLTIRVSGDVAYAYGLRHMTGVKTDGHKTDLWFRTTACFERRDGDWKITHAHNSVPFAMDGSGRALLDLEP